MRSCRLSGNGNRLASAAWAGARYNSALGFSAEHPRLMVVVSADHPVSLICEGVELNAQCEWKPVSGCGLELPTLADWVARGLAA